MDFVDVGRYPCLQNSFGSEEWPVGYMSGPEIAVAGFRIYCRFRPDPSNTSSPKRIVVLFASDVEGQAQVREAPNQTHCR